MKINNWILSIIVILLMFSCNKKEDIVDLAENNSNLIENLIKNNLIDIKINRFSKELVKLNIKQIYILNVTDNNVEFNASFLPIFVNGVESKIGSKAFSILKQDNY